MGSKNAQSQDLLEVHAFVGAIDTDIRVELKEDAGFQKITPTVEAVAASLMQGAMAQFLAKMNEVLSLDMAVPSNEQADKADSPAPAEGKQGSALAPLPAAAGNQGSALAPLPAAEGNQGSALAPLPAEGKDNSVLALGKQDSVLALPGAASADAIRLRDLPREYLAPSMQQLHGLCKRDSAEAEAGSVCLLWLDSLASLASLLADEEVPKDTEAQLVQLAAGWPALCAIQAKAMKVTKEGGSANEVAEAKRRVMVMKQLRALEPGPPAPTLADMAEQLRHFIAWHAKECKPRVDALVTKSTQVVHVFMKEKARQVQKLANVVLGEDTLMTAEAEQDGWASPFARTKRPPAPCQVAMGAGQCPLGGATLPR